MLFVSLFSKSDTWIQILVLAVSCYLRKNIKNIAGISTNSENRTDEQKPPQFDLPMSLVVVDPNSGSGYQVVHEANNTDPGELKDVINNGEAIHLEETIIEDAEDY